MMTKTSLQAAHPKVSYQLANLLHLLHCNWSRLTIDFNPPNSRLMCLPDHHEVYESELSGVPPLYKHEDALSIHLWTLFLFYI